jgi:hypothetical protein
MNGRDIRVRTANEVRQTIRRVRCPAVVQVGEPRLPPIGVGHPAQQMIEAAILHHHNHDVLDPRLLRIRQRGIKMLHLFRLAKRSSGRKRCAGNAGHTAQKVSAIDTHGGASKGDGLPAGRRRPL